MPLLLFLLGIAVIGFFAFKGITSGPSIATDDVLKAASGQVLTIKKRADELTKPVIEKVEELDRRADSVQQGLEKLREGADLLRKGVEGE